MRTICATVACLALTGCFTESKVETTEVWEGHYFTTNDVQYAVQKMQLKDKQSIWLLSNTTLKRLLKDAGAR